MYVQCEQRCKTVPPCHRPDRAAVERSIVTWFANSFCVLVPVRASPACPVSRARELCCKILSVPLVVPVGPAWVVPVWRVQVSLCTCVELFLCMFLCSKKERKLTQRRDRRTTRRHRTGISLHGKEVPKFDFCRVRWRCRVRC